MFQFSKKISSLVLLASLMAFFVPLSSSAQIGGSRSLYVQIKGINLTNRESTYRSDIPAKPNDRVRIQVTVETQGTATQNNVNVSVNLPSQVIFASGDSGIVSSGINLGTLATGSTRTSYFEITVNTGGARSYSALMTATARSDSVLTIQDTVYVQVTDPANVQVVSTSNITLDKEARNLTENATLFTPVVSAHPGDRLEFRLMIQVSGTAQSAVTVRDNLPGRLLLVSKDSMLFNGTGKSLGNLLVNSQRIINYEVMVADASAFPQNAVATLTNTAMVRSSQAGERTDNAIVLVQPGASCAANCGGAIDRANIQQSLSVFNITQNLDAITAPARPGDILSYTLRFKNNGATAMDKVEISDNLRDVLPFAQISNMGSAVALDNGVLKFGAVRVPSGNDVSKSFEVKIREASAFPSGTAPVIVNTYGNETRVNISAQATAGASLQSSTAGSNSAPAKISPPRTGPDEWFMLILAFIVTLSIWLFRSGKKYLLSLLILAAVFSLIALGKSSAQVGNLSLDVKVRNEKLGGEFLDSVNIGPNERVRFQIRLTADSAAGDIFVRDQLPAKLTFVPGTFFADNLRVNANSTQFFGRGLELGIIDDGQPITLTFLAQSLANDQYQLPQTDVTNTVYVSSASSEETQGSATVRVNRTGVGTNTQAVPQNSGTVAGAFTPAPASPLPPRTGAESWLMEILASLTTAGYWLYKQRNKF